MFLPSTTRYRDTIHSPEAPFLRKYSPPELCQISKIKLFAKELNNFPPLPICIKTPSRKFVSVVNTLLAMINISIIIIIIIIISIIRDLSIIIYFLTSVLVSGIFLSASSIYFSRRDLGVIFSFQNKSLVSMASALVTNLSYTVFFKNIIISYIT